MDIKKAAEFALNRKLDRPVGSIGLARHIALSGVVVRPQVTTRSWHCCCARRTVFSEAQGKRWTPLDSPQARIQHRVPTF